MNTTEPEAVPEAIPNEEVLRERDLDLLSLKALAHPLRVAIFDALSTYGTFTASGLAERLGESSGATSYHLRQLERHGFVREVEGRGTGRERWWERVPGGINVGSDEAISSAAGRSAANLIWSQFRRNQEKLLTDYVERGHDELSPEWAKNSVLSTVNTQLTPAQMEELIAAWQKFSRKYLMRFKGQTTPGSRPVQVQFNAFPVLDGNVIPEDEAMEAE
jgi:DNA-binding transcriptional ArsR family regulator